MECSDDPYPVAVATLGRQERRPSPGRSLGRGRGPDRGQWHRGTSTTAFCSSATRDGQPDDLTGNDAGIEPVPDEDDTPAGDTPAASAEGRTLRTGFTGRTGPH
jgi:hypothetical protein